MKINNDTFAVGTVIRVLHTLLGIPYYHYGVVVGDDDVVHFNIDFDCDDEEELVNVRIIRTDMDDFSGLGIYIVENDLMSEMDTVYSPEEIAERALSKVGSNFGGYNLVTNNCEHFANWCATGNRTSRQVFFTDDDKSASEKLADNLTQPLFQIADSLERGVDAFGKFLLDISDIFN